MSICVMLKSVLVVVPKKRKIRGKYILILYKKKEEKKGEKHQKSLVLCDRREKGYVSYYAEVDFMLKTYSPILCKSNFF